MNGRNMFPLESKNEVSLREAIIKTIVFFDLFEYPLTPLEISNYLDRRINLEEITLFLNNSNIISQKNGFYFLAGREEILTTRAKRYNYTNRKIKIARRFISLFRFLPFIRTVALANSIGDHNLRDGSDIDLFVISASRRIWLSRLFLAGAAKILGRRPTIHRKQDKICLSFYISTDHLDLSDLELAGGDPYFNYWQRSLFLLYNRERTYEQFRAVNNRDTAETKFAPTKATTGSFGNLMERLAKSFQLRVMAPDLKTANSETSGVVLCDDVLKFYRQDRRREFLDKFNYHYHAIFEKSN